MVNDVHRHAARLLLAAKASTRYSLHTAADRLAPKFSVALRAAFAVARKKSAGQMAQALEGVLAKVLEQLLVRAVMDGGRAASARLKVAEFDPNQPRDEQGQWTTYYHGTTSKSVNDIMHEGFKSSDEYPDVYLTSDFNSAEGYAVDRASGKDVDPVVFEVRVPPTQADLVRWAGGNAYGVLYKVPKDWIYKVHRGKGRRVIRGAADRPQLHMTFNATNPRIAKWAKTHAAELIDGLVKATKDWIREATTAHAEGELDDREYSEALKAAVGDEARAEIIARTETMRAVHAGQREAWQQAMDEGLLDESVKRAWIVTADDRLCPICEPLDGQTATLDGLFVGEFDGPPAHPNCRCTEGLA